MRSIGHAKRKANTNMRGRKTMFASCKCCDWVDLREDYFRALAKKEMRDHLNR
jgi:hypothetical protein